MTIFDTAFDRTMPGQGYHLGQSVTYTPHGSVAKTVRIHTQPETSRRDYDSEGNEIVIRELWAAVSTDASGEYGGVAAPSERDTVVLNSETWTVAEVTDKGGGSARLRLMIVQVVDVHRDGYRRER